MTTSNLLGMTFSKKTNGDSILKPLTVKLWLYQKVTKQNRVQSTVPGLFVKSLK